MLNYIDNNDPNTNGNLSETDIRVEDNNNDSHVDALVPDRDESVTVDVVAALRTETAFEEIPGKRKQLELYSSLSIRATPK